jgi:hypothetical protein
MYFIRLAEFILMAQKKVIRCTSIPRLANISSYPMMDLTAILICCLSFSFSYIESTLNQDNHHWGIMFVQAIGIKQGLIPHKDIMLFYGVLTSLIQSVGIRVFGENFKSLGLTTGLFYSLSLWLSYRVFLKFLTKPFALLGTLIMFLLHGYIIYPWSNYYFYTFELLAILYFLGKQVQKNHLISGGFIGLAILTRYTSMQAAVPQFLAYIFIVDFCGKQETRLSFNKLRSFLVGLATPILIFITYLIFKGGFNDLVSNNRLTFMAATSNFREKNYLQYLTDLFQNIIAFSTIPVKDSRSVFFTIIFFGCLAAFLYFVYQKLIRKVHLSTQMNTVILVSLTAIFSYLNSLHLYEVFRLANGSSLGIGVILYGIERGLNKYSKSVKLLALIPILSLCFFWSDSVILQKTSSVWSPWTINLINGPGVIARKEISIFNGKVFSQSYLNFYNEIYNKLSSTEKSKPLINYTLDTVIPLLDMSRVKLQNVPAYFKDIQEGFPDEVEKIKTAIQQRKAIIVSSEYSDLPEYYRLNLPGFKIIFDSIGPDGNRVYINVPE